MLIDLSDFVMGKAPSASKQAAAKRSGLPAFDPGESSFI
jgi:hypothetical protein